MNFFDDDFGLSSTPLYTKKPAYTTTQKGNMTTDQFSRKSAKKDEFDDLLDDLLSKQDKKSVKKKEKESMQPYSSTYLDPPPNNMDFKKTEKWSTPNIEYDQLLQSPKFPLGKPTSIMDDRISEDARSYKSGFTGRQNNLEFDNLITLRGQLKEDPPIGERSARNMMKPPLRKKQSKENLKEQKQTSLWDDQPQVSFSRRTPAIEQQTNLDLISSKEVRGKSKADIFPTDLQVKNSVDDGKVRERIIEKEKIITVREDATQLKKQFQNEVKQIKESYERQLSLAQERLKTEAEQHKKTKTTLIKQYEDKLRQERNRWEKLLSENTQRLKEVHTWQMNKKCEAYQMQIQKLKSISKFEDSIIKNQNSFHATQDNLEIKAKEREIQSEKQRLDELKFHLEQRQKHIQFEENQFNNYKRKEEEKIQMERRSLFEKQNDLKRFQLESKRNLALQKQQISSELAEAELQNFRKRQALNLEREQLVSLREMLQKEKGSFQAFNKNILNDYKMKMKQVEAQKQHLHEMEIQVHKNIHTLEMAEGTMRATNTKQFQRPSTANAQNHRNRSNTVLQSKLNETKGRFKEMQSFARKINIQTHQQRQKIKQKVNLSGYITRVNRALSKF